MSCHVGCDSIPGLYKAENRTLFTHIGIPGLHKAENRTLFKHIGTPKPKQIFGTTNNLIEHTLINQANLVSNVVVRFPYS